MNELHTSAGNGCFIHEAGPTGGMSKKAVSELLIVEDEAVLRMIWEIVVPDWGLPIEFKVLPDGYSALMEISQRVPDLIITDLDMPNVDGRALIDALLESPDYRRIPVIVVSGSQVEDVREKASVIACFGKPAPYDAIGQCVSDVIGTRPALAIL